MVQSKKRKALHQEIMEGIELYCFQIITSVGTARSCYIEAIELAHQEKFEEAKNKIKEGNDSFIEGHQIHADLVQQEAAGDSVTMSLILTHAEDQIMAAEICKIMANELIRVYEKMEK